MTHSIKKNTACENETNLGASNINQRQDIFRENNFYLC